MNDLIVYISLIMSTGSLLLSANIAASNKKIRILPTLNRKKVLIDTSGLIDGRLLTLIKNGFFEKYKIIVPYSVTHELHLLADGRDRYKRQRAKAGLDILSEIQSCIPNQVEIGSYKSLKGSTKPTDEDLLYLARTEKARLYTADYPLEKIALSQGIETVNPNMLAELLRITVKVGQSFRVLISRQGENVHQFVGYLEDGTLVVEEGASKKDIKSSLEVTCLNVIQTTSGRIIFARKM